MKFIEGDENRQNNELAGCGERGFLREPHTPACLASLISISSLVPDYSFKDRARSYNGLTTKIGTLLQSKLVSRFVTQAPSPQQYNQDV